MHFLRADGGFTQTYRSGPNVPKEVSFLVILDVRACSLHLPTAHHARPGFCHGHIRRTSRLCVNWQYNGGWRVSCGFGPLLRTGLLCLPSLLRNGVPLRTSGAMDSASGSLPTPWGVWSVVYAIRTMPGCSLLTCYVERALHHPSASIPHLRLYEQDMATFPCAL